MTLLSSKVADSSIASQKKERESSDTTKNSTTTHNLQETKIAGLQYLGGYVLHKLYRKNAKANRKESRSTVCLQIERELVLKCCLPHFQLYCLPLH